MFLCLDEGSIYARNRGATVVSLDNVRRKNITFFLAKNLGIKVNLYWEHAKLKREEN